MALVVALVVAEAVAVLHGDGAVEVVVAVEAGVAVGKVVVEAEDGDGEAVEQGGRGGAHVARAEGGGSKEEGGESTDWESMQSAQGKGDVKG